MQKASGAPSREVRTDKLAGVAQTLNDPELAEHGRLLRDDVGVEGVAEPVRRVRGARGPRGARRDDEMAAPGQRAQHAPDVFDVLLNRSGNR